MEYYGSGRCGTGYVISPLQDAHELARSGRHQCGPQHFSPDLAVRRPHGGP